MKDYSVYSASVRRSSSTTSMVGATRRRSLQVQPSRARRSSLLSAISESSRSRSGSDAEHVLQQHKEQVEKLRALHAAKRGEIFAHLEKYQGTPGRDLEPCTELHTNLDHTETEVETEMDDSALNGASMRCLGHRGMDDSALTTDSIRCLGPRAG